MKIDKVHAFQSNILVLYQVEMHELYLIYLIRVNE